MKVAFPSLVISRTSIDKVNYRHFVCGLKFINTAFKDVIIIDRDGNYFVVEGVKQVGGISVIDSVNNFAPLVKVEPLLKEPARKIDLIELKNILLHFIKSHKKNFSNLYGDDTLVDMIQGANSIPEIINYF